MYRHLYLAKTKYMKTFRGNYFDWPQIVRKILEIKFYLSFFTHLELITNSHKLLWGVNLISVNFVNCLLSIVHQLQKLCWSDQEKYFFIKKVRYKLLSERKILTDQGSAPLYTINRYMKIKKYTFGKYTKIFGQKYLWLSMFYKENLIIQLGGKENTV